MKYDSFNSYRGKTPVIVTRLEHEEGTIKIVERSNAAFRIDVYHIYRNPTTGVIIARMEELKDLEAIGKFTASYNGMEGVLVQYPDKTKMFIKGENVFVSIFHRFITSI